MAHAVLSHMTFHLPSHLSHIEIDSAGTGAYHSLSPPDLRTLSTLSSHGIHSFRHAARKVTSDDFQSFDYILAMDQDNLTDLVRKRKGLVAKGIVDKDKGVIKLFGEYGAEGEDEEEVDDPWYDAGNEGFEKAYRQCVRFSSGWLKKVVGINVEMDGKGNVKVLDG